MFFLNINEKDTNIFSPYLNYYICGLFNLCALRYNQYTVSILAHEIADNAFFIDRVHQNRALRMRSIWALSRFKRWRLWALCALIFFDIWTLTSAYINRLFWRCECEQMWEQLINRFSVVITKSIFFLNKALTL